MQTDYGIDFGSLLLIFGLSFLIPLAINQVKLFRIPEVIGEIAAGIIIGKSGFGIMHQSALTNFISTSGFVFLMFLSGLEIDFSRFRARGSEYGNEANLFVMCMSMFLLIFVLSFMISYMLFCLNIGINPLILTLILSSASLGIVMPTLKEAKMINGPLGQIILLTAVIADFSTMLMLPAVMAIISGANSAKPFFLIIPIAAFLVIYLTGKLFQGVRFIRRPGPGTSKWEVRSAFALILVFVTLAELVDIEIILGAFLAGVLYSLFIKKRKSEILPQLDAIGYGLLIPIFFIVTGSEFDFKAVLADKKAFLSLGALIISAYAVKTIPALILTKRFSMKESIGAGFLLSSNLSLTIAVSLAALKERVITQSMCSTFLLFAVFTCIVSPILFCDTLCRVSE